MKMDSKLPRWINTQSCGDFTVRCKSHLPFSALACYFWRKFERIKSGACVDDGSPPVRLARLRGSEDDIAALRGNRLDAANRVRPGADSPNAAWASHSPGNVASRFRSCSYARRWKRLRDVLRDHSAAVKEVAARVGYKNASAFVSHFRKFYGPPPGGRVCGSPREKSKAKQSLAQLIRATTKKARGLASQRFGDPGGVGGD